MAGKSLTVRNENFLNEINFSDEVFHISVILIGLDPLSC